MSERKYDGRHCAAGSIIARFETEELGECPSCGAKLGLTDFQGKLAMTHEMPFCHYFGATPPEQIERDMKAKVS